jgi:hypothetical protein
MLVTMFEELVGKIVDNVNEGINTIQKRKENN